MNIFYRIKKKLKEKKEEKREIKRLEKELRESDINQINSEHNIKKVNKCKIM